MYGNQSATKYLLLPALLLFIAACGDVGDAPRAQTGDAVEVSSLEGQTFAIDTTRSQLNWRAAKVTRAHDGGFRTFEGTVTVQDDQVVGIDVLIDTRSIWSDTDRLTSHLMSEDFFQVESYPEARFVSATVAPSDSAGATHLITGNLTMHGQTSGLTFPATIAVASGEVNAQADFIINRTDWGINYKGQADDLVEEDVRLILDIFAVPDQPIAQVNGE